MARSSVMTETNDVQRKENSNDVCDKKGRQGSQSSVLSQSVRKNLFSCPLNG